MKTESEKEISSLKKKVAELEQQLSNEDTCVGHSKHVMKKKRF